MAVAPTAARACIFASRFHFLLSHPYGKPTCGSNPKLNRPAEEKASLRGPYSYKADSGSRLVNKNGVLFVVLDNVYYALDASDIPALADLAGVRQ
jgi:hypothetical protein